ncbi:MAG: 3-isopropylmalate dehydratase small subunit [Deltaproteobacteria bacterium]|nr:3-isopropylmalate dehydratase small subunit [Deltaproteobacteria bacterium]
MSAGESQQAVVDSVTGRPIPLPGNDIDTDQIIPARYMTAVTFDGLGQHAFQDLRFEQDGQPKAHPMNDPRFRAKGPRVAIVNKNFGCGSSREHAPQALWRWGVHALVGESYADIFFNNCVAMGLPCVTMSEAEIERLMASVNEDPDHDLVVSLATMMLTYRHQSYAIEMPEGARKRLRTGAWDATGQLVQALPQVREIAGRLPYVQGFRS